MTDLTDAEKATLTADELEGLRLEAAANPVQGYAVGVAGHDAYRARIAQSISARAILGPTIRKLARVQAERDALRQRVAEAEAELARHRLAVAGATALQRLTEAQAQAVPQEALDQPLGHAGIVKAYARPLT